MRTLRQIYYDIDKEEEMGIATRLKQELEVNKGKISFDFNSFTKKYFNKE